MEIEVPDSSSISFLKVNHQDVQVLKSHTILIEDDVNRRFKEFNEPKLLHVLCCH